MGNVLELQHTAGVGSYTRTYNYDVNSNKLLSTEVGSNTYAYSHDARGNMTEMPHLSEMNWNTQNELESIMRGSEPTCYQYSNGERVRKFTDKGIIKEERIYLGNFEIYRKFEGGSLTQSTGSVPKVERTTVHVNDDTGRIAMLEVRTVGTDPSPAFLQRYIYSNHLQSASLELDENGAIISYEEYHPYGTTSYQAMNASINATAKRYRYTGKERDEESGLYYHGARYYVPWLARWTATDPINSENYNLQKGDGLAKNLGREFLELTASSYEYCYDNPVRFVDPTGEQVPINFNPNQYVINELEKIWEQGKRNIKKGITDAGTVAGKGIILSIAAEVNRQFYMTERIGSFPKIKGTFIYTGQSGKKTDTHVTSADKFNLYVNQNTLFNVDESNANNYKDYPLNVVTEMMNNFISGKGPENYNFPVNGIISREFLRSHVLHNALKAYLKSPDTEYKEQIEFGVFNLLNDIRKNETIASIPGMTGSASITITPGEKGISVKIFNITSLTSGSFGKELANEDLWPKSRMRTDNGNNSFSNISQTYNLFIPWGTDKGEDKYQRINNVINYSAWYKD